MSRRFEWGGNPVRSVKARLDGSPSIKPEYNCDFTHPNAAGYRPMGEAVDLRLFDNVGVWRNGK